MKKSLLSLTLLCLSLPAASQPNTSALDGLTIGVLASLDANAYATDDKVGVLPLVLYDQESIKTGMNAHTVKSSYSPFVMVSGKYRFGDHVGAFASTKAQWLSSTQKNSPLTDGKMDIKANMGLTYTF